MAANNIATMSHTNTNKITPILVYAVLEWTLIILLLLNSVISYLIIKFAQFFGLHPPCFSCARVDRFRYHLCDRHSREVSQLRLCLNHKKLAEFGDLCENCTASVLGIRKESRNFVFSMVERIDSIKGVVDDEVDFGCSCCGMNFDKRFDDETDFFVIHPVCDEKELETEEHEIEVTRESNPVEFDLIQFKNEEDLSSKNRFESTDPKTEEHLNNFEDEDQEFGEFQKADMNSDETTDSIPQKTEVSSKFSEKTLRSHENLIDFADEKVANDDEIRNPIIESKELQEDDSDSHTVQEEQEQEVGSIGAEIPVLNSCDDFPSHLDVNERNLKNLSIKIEEIEEDKAPNTPSGIHSPNPFHKRWLIATNDSVTVDSLDETGDSINMAAKLELELKAEQKMLRDLYMELEEERNASAVAASETMAMITRLQEEKAAMRMEALQYQRMMEEQSEYDQEALQLLNELMMKKEKELESYKKKVFDYQARESIRVLKRGTKTGTSSNSWSHSDDDESSFDVYHVPEVEHSNDRDLESALAEFEEERVSILDQLKFLEEKLVTLSDQEDQHYANVRVIYYEEINNFNYTTNGYLVNGKQAMGKQVLPLFDMINNGVEDDVTVRNGQENGFHPLKIEDTSITRFELEKKRIDMEDEMEELYRRLQALEGDREFFKHCIASIKKGDKGMEVLQNILHLLRDLREINVRAKNYSDSENIIL